jgi:acetyl-CoA carboxylase biotin carboxyl carrier protein
LSDRRRPAPDNILRLGRSTAPAVTAAAELRTEMASLDIDTDFVGRLAELLQRTGLTEIEISQGDTRVRVAKQVQTVVEYVAAPGGGHHVPAPLAAQTGGPAPAPGRRPRRRTRAPSTRRWSAPPTSPPSRARRRSWASARPVKEGQTLLIIEAMKVMNAIRAPRAGRVARIYVENAAPVEYGEPLMALE